MKYSPTPWKTHNGTNIVDVDGKEIAHVIMQNKADGGFDRTVSNVNLLRAAPKMLEALKSVAQSLDTDVSIAYEWPEVYEAIAMAEDR